VYLSFVLSGVRVSTGAVEKAVRTSLPMFAPEFSILCVLAMGWLAPVVPVFACAR